ncbi:MAG: sulfite exporter TauE/SafE family protein, partial [Chloroflexota bacterium]
PALILVGFEAKHAAGMTALAVTLPSFSALIPHLSTAIWDPTLTITLVVAGSIASFLGARVTSLYVPPLRLKQLFGVVIVLMTAYRVITII